MTTIHDLQDRLTLSVPEAGEMLGISSRSAYRAVERGVIPVIRIGSRILVPKAKLLDMLGVGPRPIAAAADDDRRREPAERRAADSA